MLRKGDFTPPGSATSRTKGSLCEMKIYQPTCWVTSAFPGPRRNFVLSGNEIVFSGKNELITDAACANNDNLLHS